MKHFTYTCNNIMETLSLPLNFEGCFQLPRGHFEY